VGADLVRSAGLHPHLGGERGTDTHRLAARRDESLEVGNDDLGASEQMLQGFGGFVRPQLAPVAVALL
jgi:hypothetical protein